MTDPLKPLAVSVTKLRDAKDVRATTANFDLSPVLDNIADSIEGAAAQGLFHVSVEIKDSVFAQHTDEIRAELTKRGYVINDNNIFNFEISWAA